jgi:threonine dehydratase
MGSGICGLIGVRDLLGLSTEVVGVVSEAAPATALSFTSGEVRTTPEAATFVDGVACRAPVPEAVEQIVRGAARVLAVPEDASAEAMRVMLRTTHQLPEPAGAIALAGLLSERDRASGLRVAVVHSGGNCDASVLAEVLAGSTPRP